MLRSRSSPAVISGSASSPDSPSEGIPRAFPAEREADADTGSWVCSRAMAHGVRSGREKNPGPRVRASQPGGRFPEPSIRSGPGEARRLPMMDRMLAFSPDVICTVDRKGCLYQISGASEKILGYSPDELAGRPFLDLIPEEEREKAGRMLQKAARGAPLPGLEIACLRRDGVLVPLSWSASWSDEEQLMICIGRDISGARRETEALRTAKQAAELANHAKSDFLANMSHEIRTPMNGVLGMTEVLLHTALNAEQRDFVETIRRSGEMLLTIVNDVLDFSKIEAGKLRFENAGFDLEETLEGCTRMTAAGAKEGGVSLFLEIHPDIPRRITGDAGRLRQVITNLLSNAIRFTDRAGKVHLRALPDRKDQQGLLLRFEIQDTGIGVDGETQKRLFEPFTQADASTTRKYGGTGLGLAICRRLVGMMGGEIGLKSELGKGALFHFTARFGYAPQTPLSLSATGAAASLAAASSSLGNIPPETASSSRPRLLLAEDNPTNQKVALLQLRRLGHHADAVANGKEVLAAMEDGAYDVILMDCQMPELDGFDTSRRLRETFSRSALHIIALTASAMSGDRERCLAAGMNDYITKPVRAEELEAALDRWRESRAETAARR